MAIDVGIALRTTTILTASLFLSACIFTVDHTELPDLDASDEDVYSAGDEDADTDSDPGPDTNPEVSVVVEVSHDVGPVEDGQILAISDTTSQLKFEFICESEPADAECVVECAISDEIDPPTTSWEERCSDGLTVEVLLDTQQDLFMHYRATHTDDSEVHSGPHVHSTRVRFDFELTTLPPEELYYGDHGTIEPECNSPVTGESFECVFETCRWDSDEAELCDDGALSFELQTEVDELTIEACSAEFPDHCVTYQTTYSLVPPVWKSVATAIHHTCAILADNTLWCWGEGEFGQLGVGANPQGDIPERVEGLWKEVSSGTYHTCGIRLDDTLWCWGLNQDGEVDPGISILSSNSPHLTHAGPWESIAAGAVHTCAITTDQELYCWGDSTVSVLGPDPKEDELSRVPHPDGHGWNQVTSGLSYSCAIDEHNDAWCWGDGSDGRLGNGETSGTFPDPVKITGRTFSSLSASYFHACGKSTDGVYCWGVGESGRLGNDDEASRSTPTRVENTEYYSHVAPGGEHTCGINENERAYCWGSDVGGQLGLGPESTDDVLEPQVIEGGHSFATIAAGARYTCAITTAGRLLCWGNSHDVTYPVYGPTPTPIDWVHSVSDDGG